mmetsp:Transcript_20453/g.70259  ORF Transcript_20453/g.70259 Transcript_20453/m.70259 type:complete len:310 (+) Transcript_20453:318-1247(+)
MGKRIFLKMPPGRSMSASPHLCETPPPPSSQSSTGRGRTTSASFLPRCGTKRVTQRRSSSPSAPPRKERPAPLERTTWRGGLRTLRHCRFSTRRTPPTTSSTTEPWAEARALHRFAAAAAPTARPRSAASRPATLNALRASRFQRGGPGTRRRGTRPSGPPSLRSSKLRRYRNSPTSTPRRRLSTQNAAWHGCSRVYRRGPAPSTPSRAPASTRATKSRGPRARRSSAASPRRQSSPGAAALSARGTSRRGVKRRSSSRAFALPRPPRSSATWRPSARRARQSATIRRWVWSAPRPTSTRYSAAPRTSD